ncbi:MAG TPA: LysR family transcriptional regulator [Burkholderiales bacterium]
MKWSDISLVLAICRAGTLSGAAKILGVDHSTVFRRINAIEKELNVRLFDRQPSGYVMTDAGRAVERAGTRIEEEVHGLARELLGRDLRLKGRVRVTAPEGIGLKLLRPRLIEFCKAHPGIDMELVITSTPLRLSHREADVAVRVTRRPPPGYVGRRICKFRFCMYASRSYLERYRNAALEDYHWLYIDDGLDYLPRTVWTRRERSPQIVFRSNNNLMAIEAAKEGLGVTTLPCFLGDAEPDLVRVAEPVEALTQELWVLTHPDLRASARVKALMAMLVDGLREEKSRIEGAC